MSFLKFFRFNLILGALLASSVLFSQDVLTICDVTDSSSGLSRSFALQEILEHADFKNNQNNKLQTILGDFPYNSTYGISGEFYSEKAEFKMYKNGKRVKIIVSNPNWKDVIAKIIEYLAQEGYQNSRKINYPNEGLRFKFNDHTIAKALPGQMDNYIPRSTILDTFNTIVNVKSLKYYNLEKVVIENFGNSRNYNESDLFFFRNSNVPSNLKQSIRDMIFPVSNWLTPSLTYLSAGQLYYNEGEYPKALNCFYASLRSSNSLLVSRYERALLKDLNFSLLAKIYSKNSNTKDISLLYEFAHQLNSTYFKSDKGIQDKNKYYSLIAEITKICNSAEADAKRIRSESRSGFFTAILTTTAAVASSSIQNNAAADMYASQTKSVVDQTFKNANLATMDLQNKFKDFEKSLNGKSFVDMGGDMDLGSHFVSNELFYYLYNDPELLRSMILEFAKDKPKLTELINEYYKADSPNDKSNALKRLTEQMVKIETVILKYEVRNNKLPANFYSEF